MDMHDEDFLLQFDMLICSSSWSLFVSGSTSNSNNRSSAMLISSPRDCNAENLSYASLSAWETQLRNLCKSSFLAPCKVGLDMPAFLVEGSMSAALPMKLQPQ